MENNYRKQVCGGGWRVWVWDGLPCVLVTPFLGQDGASPPPLPPCISPFPAHAFPPTDGVIGTLSRRQITVDEDILVLDVIDTAGQEQYTACREQYLITGPFPCAAVDAGFFLFLFLFFVFLEMVSGRGWGLAGAKPGSADLPPRGACRQLQRRNNTLLGPSDAHRQAMGS